MSLYLHPLSKHPQIIPDTQFVTGRAEGKLDSQLVGLPPAAQHPGLGPMASSQPRSAGPRGLPFQSS